MKFDFSQRLQEAYSQLLWQRNPHAFDEGLPEVTLVTIRLFLEILGNIRDLYVGYFFAVGIVTLWAISYSFKCSIVKDIRLRNNVLYLPRIEQYQAISKLARSFSKGHGYSLLSYCMWNILYYSIGLDRIFIPMNWGEKFYELEFAVLTLLLSFGLGAHFSYQVYIVFAFKE